MDKSENALIMGGKGNRMNAVSNSIILGGRGTAAASANNLAIIGASETRVPTEGISAPKRKYPCSWRSWECCKMILCSDSVRRE